MYIHGIAAMLFAVTHLFAGKLGLAAGLAALGFAATEEEEYEPQVVRLKPEQIKVLSNVRFNLKAARIARLSEDILEAGGVEVPITVFELETPENGYTHGLITGGYRTASVTKLNKEKGAGLTLPAIVRAAPDTASLVRQQIRENMERENMSTMDEALAIKQALEAGIPKPEVRKMFARPNAKGKLEAASNAFVNMLVSFLDFPKAIQARIHNNEIGVKAAYELRKAPSDKWEAILSRLEQDRQDEIELESKLEEKYLADIAKDEKKNKRQIELKAELETAEKELAEATEKKVAASKAATEKYQLTKEDLPEEIKTAAAAATAKAKRHEAWKAAEKDAAETKKVAEKAKLALDKLQEKSERVAENARQQAKKLEEKRKLAAANKPVSQEQVKKATAKETGDGHVPLSKSDIMDAVNTLALPGNPPKVKAIGEVIKQHFQGITTPKELMEGLCKVTGEKWVKPRAEK